MTPRKDANTGTWSFVIEMPRSGGGRKQIHRRGFATKKDALAAEAEYRSQVNKGQYRRLSRLTVGDYLLEEWLPNKRRELRPTTALGYEKVIRTRVVPFIGDVPLSQVDAIALESFYGQLLVSGGRGGSPLSPKTVANAAGVLSIALGDAVRLKKLLHNPAKDARLPKRERPNSAAWTAEEVVRFLASVEGDRLFPLWALALATGMRRGELCGLMWDDFDFAAGKVSVNRTRIVAAEVIEGPPKTQSGVRTISLDPQTLAVMKSWRATQAREQLAAGEAWQGSGYVFADELGTAPHPETLTRWWREAVANADVPPIRLHDVRHTAASLMIRQKVPLKVVSERLGHADIAVTLRVYQHVIERDDEEAATVLGGILWGKR